MGGRARAVAIWYTFMLTMSTHSHAHGLDGGEGSRGKWKAGKAPDTKKQYFACPDFPDPCREGPVPAVAGAVDGGYCLTHRDKKRTKLVYLE